MKQPLPVQRGKHPSLRAGLLLKKYKVFLLFAITAFMSLSPYLATAQRVYPDMELSVSNKGSDYVLTFDWNGLDVIDCNTRGLFQIRKNGIGDGNIVYQEFKDLPNSGTFDFPIGPGQGGLWGVRYQEGNPEGGCLTWVWSGFPRAFREEDTRKSGYGLLTGASTAAIKNPTGVTASSQSGFDNIELKWEKGTDIPDSNSFYRIYREGVLIHTADGDQRSWKDASLDPGQTRTYTIRTYASKWGGHQSFGVTVTGSTKSMGLTASDGTFASRVRLEWVNISSFADNIRIERNLPNTSVFEEIDILNKNATFYNDLKAIPGYTYTYRLTPIKDGRTFPSYPETGYMTPNGKISGTVKSRFGANVPGVIVTATGKVNGQTISSFNHDGKVIQFRDTTDAAGYFEIDSIYYFEKAEFTLTPFKGDHEFDPATQKRTLEQSLSSVNSVDFTDNTVYTIAGTVKDPNGCPVQGVTLLLDGKDGGYRTDKAGLYLISVENEGTYNVKPVYFHHTFNKASENVTIAVGMGPVNFIDTQQEKVLVSLLSGCGDAVSRNFTVRIRSAAGDDPDAYCYDKEITITGGSQELELPARKYSLQVVRASDNSSNIELQMGKQGPIEADLTERKIVNGLPAVRPAAFVFHEGIEVTFRGLTAARCTGNLYVMEQNTEYPVIIEVKEINSFLNTRCFVDAGELKITDDVGDRGIVNLDAGNGSVPYSIKGGLPNIVAPNYTKRFEVTATVGFAVPATANISVIVTGGKPRVGTFVTKTPELPHLILHDPMGDKSYSFLQKDSSYSFTTQTSVATGAELGLYAKIKVGGGFSIFGSPEIGAGIQIKTELKGGGEIKVGDEQVTTITASQQLSTADTDVFTGPQGDVFVGASYNIRYGLIDIVKVVDCRVEKEVSLYWNPESVATTYAYTDYQVRNNILTQLNRLRDITQKRYDLTKIPSALDTVKILTASINVWQQVLDNNDKQRAQTLGKNFIENRSFSAGAPFSSTITSSTQNTTTYDFSAFINLQTAIGAFLYVGDFTSIDLGVQASFKWSTQTTTTATVAKSTTIGYHLDDDDIGDFFSVDIYNDPRYNTPLFKLNAGTSSCPNEPGTQTRDKPQIDLNRYTVSNVPAGEPAVFVANIANVNESEEGREYAVRVIPSTNMDGAIVRMGGQIISTTPVVYFLQPGPSIPITITVERGPYAFNYEDIKLIMYPECEYKIFQNGGSIVNADTVSLSVNFQSQCSTVQISKPADNWLINQGSANKMTLTFTGYNVNNPSFTAIGLQYRPEGQNWETAVTIPKAQLIDQFKDYVWDVSDLSRYGNGKYEIRAFATCETLGQTTYSAVLQGNIDRSSVAPFGTPAPADGFLRQGQNISVTFDKTIKCGQNFGAKVSLIRGDNGSTLPVTVQCAGNTLIIKTNPESAINDLTLAGVELTATVSGIEDNAGNIQKYPTVWSFKVNVKPVFWDPDKLEASLMTGSGVKLKAEIKNTAEISKGFKITGYPNWLTPSAQRGVIQPYGFFGLEFAISDELKPGLYEGVITAEVDGFTESMPVKLELLAVPVSWKVNASAYNYSMNIVAQYTLSKPPSNVPVSKDTRDVIGVFVNGVPRGVGRIRPVEGMPGTFAAFLTVFSDEPAAGREILTFRMWNALSGVEYGALETTPFVVDGTLGTAAAPYVLHPEGTFQVIPLKKGWNWVSLNVANPDMSREKIFGSILSSGNTIQIKSQTDFSNFSPQSGWSGTLRTINLTSGYMVHLSDRPDTLRIVGSNPPAGPLAPVALTGTWNWIGYPRIANADVKTALGASFPARAGDVLKSATAFATFTNPPAPGIWIGDLRTMDPGMGYKLRLSAPASLAYGRKSAGSADFEVYEQNYEYNMTLTGALYWNGGESTDARFTVGAFIDGICRGFAEPQYVPQSKVYRVFLTIHGEVSDDGKPVQFRVMDAAGSEALTFTGGPVRFKLDQIIGSVEKPYVLDREADGLQNGYYLAQNQPNPFSGQTAINFTIPRDEPVKLILLNQFGLPVRVLLDERKTAGNYQVRLHGNQLRSGVYFYTLQAGDYVKTRKLILVR